MKKVGKKERTSSAELGIHLLRRGLGGIESKLAITQLESSVVLATMLAVCVLVLQTGKDVALGRVEGPAVDIAVGRHGFQLECSDGGRRGGGRASDGDESDASFELHCSGWD